ncbi:MAG TPA: adenosylcobinamide-phosphate synthase CbiB [bacterium]|jgi:adenosylcobinamide-phosphate synthase|nr:adenosylcobinamide-phosphate synthase CbiB [bacterium]
MTSGVLAAAAALDLALGDPEGAWHPVRLMGALIMRAETWARARPQYLKLRGVVLAAGVLSTTFLAGELALWLAAGADRALGSSGALVFAVQALMLWSCLGIRSMVQHARAVLEALRQGDMACARAAVARIVGRDVSELDEAGIRRACLESVAESLGDGVMGPLLFALLGGGPLALVYRAANTLDSMLGHKDERYRELGWASARLDDLLSWLPARQAALATVLGAACLRLDFRGAWLVARRDAPGQPSPNSGWPEGAFAGALGVRLGGPLSYRGRVVEKAFLGRATRILDQAVCEEGLKLFLAACLAALLVDEALLWCLSR